ncbi:hypothetical protein PVAP13_5NG470500 [Panicum virgatum]|uniref:Uncharacterized protein n=1 Tax=Panicum virgatum TaxID=38727 RepID=A0A8T0S3E1_PANVG|nr:hypothetical protein PVAP13_5NG470500 [Panicum virgatum]
MPRPSTSTSPHLFYFLHDEHSVPAEPGGAFDRATGRPASEGYRRTSSTACSWPGSGPPRNAPHRSSPARPAYASALLVIRQAAYQPGARGSAPAVTAPRSLLGGRDRAAGSPGAPSRRLVSYFTPRFGWLVSASRRLPLLLRQTGRCSSCGCVPPPHSLGEARNGRRKYPPARQGGADNEWGADRDRPRSAPPPVVTPAAADCAGAWCCPSCRRRPRRMCSGGGSSRGGRGGRCCRPRGWRRRRPQIQAMASSRVCVSGSGRC